MGCGNSKEAGVRGEHRPQKACPAEAALVADRGPEGSATLLGHVKDRDAKATPSSDAMAAKEGPSSLEESSTGGSRQEPPPASSMGGSRQDPAPAKVGLVGKSEPQQLKCGMRKQRTVAVDQTELDLMVVGFSCHDDTVLQALGKHCKRATWRIQVGPSAKPLEIQLNVDTRLVGQPEVAVSCDGERLFPAEGEAAKSKMKDDFSYRWPFRGTAQGLGERGLYQMRPAGGISEQWFEATLVAQRPDGNLEVLASMPDGMGGVRDVTYPAIPPADLRRTGSCEPLRLPERCLVLEVPRESPLSAALRVDGSNQPFTQHFAKPSPPPVAQGECAPELKVTVSQDRQRIKTNMGHATLRHFLAGELQAVSAEHGKWTRSWVLQIGPFAEHRVALEKTQKSGKMFKLSIDGHPFVEATAQDLNCDSEMWECKFRFVGERTVDFEVYETDVNGITLDSRAHVGQRRRYSHECCVLVKNEADLEVAELTVDDVDFGELPLRPPPHNEDSLEMDLQAFQLEYGLFVPHRVNEKAPASSALFGNLAGTVAIDPQFFRGTQAPKWGPFACCANQNSAPHEDELIP